MCCEDDVHEGGNFQFSTSAVEAVHGGCVAQDVPNYLLLQSLLLDLGQNLEEYCGL